MFFKTITKQKVEDPPTISISDYEESINAEVPSSIKSEVQAIIEQEISKNNICFSVFSEEVAKDFEFFCSMNDTTSNSVLAGLLYYVYLNEKLPSELKPFIQRRRGYSFKKALNLCLDVLLAKRNLKSFSLAIFGQKCYSSAHDYNGDRPRSSRWVSNS